MAIVQYHLHRNLPINLIAKRGYANNQNEVENRLTIGYQFIKSSDDLLQAHEFMAEGRLIEEFEEKHSNLSDYEINREMAQINFIIEYINFIIRNQKL